VDKSNQIQLDDKDDAKLFLANFWLKIRIKVKKIFKKKSKSHTQDHDKLNQKLVYGLSSSKIPNTKQLKHFRKVLNSKENKLINILLIFILVNLIFFASVFYKKGVESVPTFGGQYQEGLVGLPRYVNPLYSFSDVDSDISLLIFSSLFKYNGNADLSLDLIKNYAISDNGKIYNFTIKEDVKWHDGEKLTVDDIVFTFQAILNPEFRSPWLAVFQGIEVEKIDDYNFKIVLDKPYSGFTELLSFGILPQHLWQNINPATANLAELNLKPIGSGPYKFKSLIKNKLGEIKSYNLQANQLYYNQVPYIKDVVFKFYPNFNALIAALNNDEIEGASYLSPGFENNVIATNSLNFHKLLLNQVNAIFFNQAENEALASLDLRKALALAIDKEKMVNESLNLNAIRAKGPLPASSLAFKEDLNTYRFNQVEAEKLIQEAGWNLQIISRDDVDRMDNLEEENLIEGEEIGASDESGPENKNDTSWQEIKNLAETTGLELIGKWRYKEEDDKKQYLIITLTVPKEEISLKLSNEIKNYWQELGVRTIINEVKMEEIQKNIIDNKNFEAIIYGEMFGFNPDPYTYWHSEEKLNISNYSNEEVDKLLENIRISFNQEEKIESYHSFQEKINQDVPAIFLYSSFYIYPQNKKIKNFNTSSIIEPRDRLANISSWYIKTKNKLSFSNIFK